MAIDEYIKLGEVYYSLADLISARKTYTQALRLAQRPGMDRQCKSQYLAPDGRYRSAEFRLAAGSAGL
jgi:hypothetical protein